MSTTFSKEESDILETSQSNKDNEIIYYLSWRETVIDFMVVRADCRCPISAGNILENSLTEIWNGEGMQLYRKKLLAHDYKNFCRSECSLSIIPSKILKGNIT
ncbi:SPASM domain-containing protein [Patescibacteria group bacterium]|nr:SPASM domain-containing protein [Patescibacteria group bacterium]MBU1524678.1 SPASM domain-containing protein [Candidatus Omnitrophota bacterium]MBU2504498.1 SPASM domain-containing protein [Candidatus Omnitrophota bacterium]